MDNYELFMVALRTRMDRREATQIELSKATSKTPGFINMVMRRTRKASEDVQSSIAKYFGLTLREFINEGYAIEYKKQSLEDCEVDPVMDLQKCVSQIAESFERTRQEKAFWQCCFDAVDTPISVVNENGIITHHNQPGRNVFKISLIGENYQNWCDQSDYIILKNNYCPVCKCGDTGVTQKGVITIHGIPYEVIANPVLFQKEQHVVFTLREISYEFDILAEAQLYKKVGQALFNEAAANTAMAFLDQDKNVHFVNDNFLKLFDKSREQLTKVENIFALLLEISADHASEIIKTAKQARDNHTTLACSAGEHKGDEWVVQFCSIFDDDKKFIGVLTKIMTKTLFEVVENRTLER